MTVKIPENATKLELDKALQKLDKAQKTFDASKYIGKIKFTGDPVEFQRELR